MKLSGVDGIIVDWDGRNINEYRHKTLMDILPYIEKYQLELLICFEEWAGYWPIGICKNRDEEVKRANDELIWLMKEICQKPFYSKINGKSPVLIFRKVKEKLLNKDEFLKLTDTIEKNNGTVIFPTLDNDYIEDVASGVYFWIGDFDEHNCSLMEDGLSDYQKFIEFSATTKSRGDRPLVVGCVCPGFDDTYVWGWGTVPHIAPRVNGERFIKMWEMSLKSDVDMVQILTWNDWNEGSHIEPSDTFNDQYLEINKKYSSMFKGKVDNIPNEILKIPIEIYKLRKKNMKKEECDEIIDLLLDLKFEFARERIKKVCELS